MGIGQVLTMPLFFANNSIYPIAIMPGWLQTISKVNPLIYKVVALHAMMFAGGTSTFGLGLDLAVLIITTGVLIAVGSILYPRVVV